MRFVHTYFLLSNYKMSSAGNINIDPSTITDVKTITSFRVSINGLELFSSVSLRVELLGQEGGLLDIRYVVLTGDDYLNWKNDDNYIITTVAQKLGFVLAPTAPTASSDPTA